MLLAIKQVVNGITSMLLKSSRTWWLGVFVEEPELGFFRGFLASCSAPWALQVTCSYVTTDLRRELKDLIVMRLESNLFIIWYSRIHFDFLTKQSSRRLVVTWYYLLSPLTLTFILLSTRSIEEFKQEQDREWLLSIFPLVKDAPRILTTRWKLTSIFS